MAQKEPRMSAKSTLPNANPAEFVEMGRKQVESMMALHKELIDAIERSSSRRLTASGPRASRRRPSSPPNLPAS